MHSLYAGHEHTFGVSRGVPWGILIAAYVFFVVTSTGLCIVSSVGHVFGFENFNPIAKRAVFLSIATIVAGFLVIAFEIENSWRMPVGNVIGANPTSNIWWMGTLYGAYLFFMMIEFVMLQKEQHKIATAFGLAGLLTGVAAHSNLGAVFGLVERPRVLARAVYADLFYYLGGDVRLRGDHLFHHYCLQGQRLEDERGDEEVDGERGQDGGPDDGDHHLFHLLEDDCRSDRQSSRQI